MFLIASFLVVGGVAFAVDRVAGTLLFVVAGTMILWYPMAAIMWFNDHTGSERFIIGSWQSLSGVRNPGEVYQQCGGGSSIPSNSLWGVALIAALWALSIFLVFINLFLGFGAIVGVPVGIVAAGLGAIGTLVTRTKEPLYAGLVILVCGLGCLVAAGLVMRIVHFSTGIMC